MKLSVAAFAVALSVSAMVAQTAAASTIQQRKVRQQDRIAQGVRSGELRAGQTARLEHQERGINREERGMRAQDHGRLTAYDRRTIHRQQNVESRRIYRDKHERHAG
jgi:hypothetical protein